MIVISLVTGTYNRLNYLKDMIHSFKYSLGLGTSYEIIVVDGGSTDGTIEWCKAQDDIRLIEQGELLGAVKAFNEGAYSANGKYVILANDDIVFIGDSILYALRHMEENICCGIGCFYQDRGSREYHVEQMPAVKNGKQISVYYGQVCIVRTYLGNSVGWWGDYLHTYGGDNELSCNVLQLGWTVEPIECACIHDITPDDELRRRNNHRRDGNHPDTQKWLNKWTRNGLVGVDLTNVTGYASCDSGNSLHRILYLPIYEPGNVIQKQTKRGLRDALANVGIVYEIDYVNVISTYGKNYFMAYMYDILDALKPTIVLTQFHDAKTVNMSDVHVLKNHHSCIWVNWNGDYHPEHLYNQQYMMFLKMFHLSGFVTTAVKEKYSIAGINQFYWQIGYEGKDVTASQNNVKKHDIVFLANGYSADRLKLARRLRMLPYNVGLYGYWPKELRPDGENVYNFDEGYQIYANAKVAISDAQWPDVGGYVSNRMFQVLFSGVCLFQQNFKGVNELLGLIDNVNCVIWDDFDHLEYLLTMHLGSSDLQAIGARGKELVENFHSFDHRVKELLDELFKRKLL